METKIEKIGGEWKVTFTHVVQTFILDFTGTKKECQWYKDRLDECFARAFGDKLEREKANELLPLVSNRRELLSGFASYIHKHYSSFSALTPHVHIDDYLATL